MIYSFIIYLNYIEEYILYIVLYSALLGIGFKSEHFRFRKLIIYIIIFPLLGLIAELIIDSFALQKLTLLIIEIISIIYMYNPRISDIISLYIINYTLTYIIQEIIAFTAHLFTSNIDNYRFGLLANLLTIILVYILTKLINLHPFFHYLTKENNPLKLIVINAFAFLQIIDYYYKVKPDIYNMNIIFIGICVLIVITLNLLIAYEEQRLLQKEILLKNTEFNSSLMQEMITEIRRTQHQYEDRLNSIISLVNVCLDYDTLKEELLKYSDKLTIITNEYDILKLNYKLLAALIFSKINEAKSINKHLNVTITNYNITTKVSENELVDILSIMINNMLDATPTNEACEVTLGSKNSRIIIKTKNEGPKITPTLQEKLFTKGYTTKEDIKSHGFGLYNLKKIILNYDGYFMVMNEYSPDKKKTYIVFTVEV